MEFKEILEKRYATKLFDGKKIPEEKIEELKEYIRLAPSSFGLQPFKVMVIEGKDTKEALLPASYNQKQITTCSHLLVFCAYTNIKERIDEVEKMMKDAKVPEEKYSTYIGMMRDFEKNIPEDRRVIWAQKQCYIALGNALNGAKALGFDSCPMEGFDANAYSKILGLPENLIPTIVCPVGYGADTPHPKMRFKKEELFFK